MTRERGGQARQARVHRQQTQFRADEGERVDPRKLVVDVAPAAGIDSVVKGCGRGVKRFETAQCGCQILDREEPRQYDESVP